VLPLFAAPLIFAQLVATTPAALPGADQLLAAAAASPRPKECSSLAHAARARASHVWEQARRPGIGEYCDLLARGYASLGRSPETALEAGARAARIMHGRAAPLVLEARAELALGGTDRAWKLFSSARAADKRSTEAPEALHDFAVTAERTGHVREALAAYRALVARADMLESALCRERVYVEAAALAMQQGASGLNEAVGYLSEARQRSIPPGFEDYVLSALALALDRQGSSDEASGVAAEVETTADLRAALKAPGARSGTAECAGAPVLPPGELHAMIAIVAQRQDADLAREQWSAYLASAHGAWTGYAKKKLAALGGKRRKARRR
jgi:hypothetical protein